MEKRIVTTSDWTAWLTEWNRELLKFFDLTQYARSGKDDDLTAEIVASGWLGNSRRGELPTLSTFSELMQDQRRAFLTVQAIAAQQMQPNDDLKTVVEKLQNLIKKFEKWKNQYGLHLPDQEMAEAVMEHMIRDANSRIEEVISLFKAGIVNALIPR